jgi:sugar phosphate isomerase/epimerase
MRTETATGPVWLGPCTNVLPVEDLPALLAALEEVAGPLADRFAPGEPFGVGLHLTAATARRLEEDPGAIAGLREALERHRLVPFTVNAFPYGGFHAARVKENVYRPDWLARARLDHTLRVARVLAALLPEGERGTISTLAGTFDPWRRGPEVEAAVADVWTRAARSLAGLREETGRRIVLCPEPEPLTTLETTEEVVRFWGERLDRGDLAVREHLALCFDCCHQAVEHEELPEALARLEAAGVPIGKVQVSSALEVDPGDAAAVETIRRFDEPRYLHQVIAPDGEGRLARAADLPDVLGDLAAWRGRRPWRVHFHVPVEREAFPPLRTTREALVAGLRAVVAGRLCDHLEVETYTWAVLPEDERPRTPAELTEGLARELAFTRSVVEGA